MLKDITTTVPDFDVMLQVFQSGILRKSSLRELIETPKGKNILIIAPHQDDGTVGAGGTILKSVRAGKEVVPLYVTNGCWHDDTRKKEAQRVWKKINGAEPICLDIPCQKITASKENISRLATELRRIQPDTIFIPFMLEPPKDHRNTAKLLHYALRESGLRDSPEIWQYQVSSVFTPNVLVDITDVAEEKRKLNSMWESQNVKFDFAHYAWGKDIANTYYFRSYFSEEGHKPRPKKPFAEIFFVSSAGDYQDIMKLYLDHEK